MLVELRYGIKNPQAGAGSTLRIVVVGLGIAEESHHAIAKVLGDMPAEALDCLRRRMMISGDDLAPLFGIKTACYLRRADEVAEEHRQMAALALWHFMWLAVFAYDGCGCMFC